ncbi:MAG: hypothetical protein PVG60_08620, partial [Desulfarculaceae bacterium]
GAYRDQPQLPSLDSETFSGGDEAGEAKPSFFFYLDAKFRSTALVLKAMTELKMPCEGYVSNLTPAISRLCGDNIEMIDSFIPLKQIFSNYLGLIHHGGSMINGAAAAGQPQFLLPKQISQKGASWLLAQTGAAICAPSEGADQYQKIKKDLKRFWRQDSFRRKAKELAGQIQKQPKVDAVQAVLQKCLEVLA